VRKTNRQYIYIVENIKFIYTSFDEFFLPVSQRVDMNYIFCKSKLNNDIVFHIKYAWIPYNTVMYDNYDDNVVIILNEKQTNLIN
jgi:hypothetical protein